MSNRDALVHERQVIINDTTAASASGGSLVVLGGLSTKDTFVTGHVSVNNVRITPNLNDIVLEQQFVLEPDTTEFTDITEFYFKNTAANSFRAQINVTVSAGNPKYALFDIRGVFRNTGWVLTSSFTGGLTGVNFDIANTTDASGNSIGQLQYTNTNPGGTTTTIRYRAQTTAPPGTTPTGSTGIINNTSGPYISGSFIYANSENTIASSDILYDATVLTIGGASRIVALNENSFTSFSNGGAITSLGDASIAQNLIVGQKIGIVTTSPAFEVDVDGDINFTGSLYQNGNLFGEASIWESNGNDIFYTQGNLGIGTTAPAEALHVIGSSIISVGLTTGNINFTGDLYKDGEIYISSQWETIGSDISFTNGNVGIGTTAPAQALHVIGSSIISVGLTTGNINFTGDLYKDGEIYISSQWETIGSDISFTNGNVGIGTTAPSYKLHVEGTIFASDDITAFSDMRKKKDIVTIDDSLSKVNALRGVYYTSIASEKRSLGVVAQELEEVIPEAVLTDDQGFKSVAYGNIAGILIEAIKELSAKVQELESKCEC
jgi:hypothetical protein